ncbi:cupin domain protein [Venturia nashicola]|nr:cupin domain protein [Venturia nashicola]
MNQPVYDATLSFPSFEILYEHKLLNAPDEIIFDTRVPFPSNTSTPPRTHGGASVAIHILAASFWTKTMT